MNIPQRRAVSPIIATLLLIAIAVASGVVVYVFTNGLASNLTKAHVGQVTEQVSLDAYSYSPVGSGVTLYLRNTGSGALTINSYYFDGAAPSGTLIVTQGSSPCSSTLNVGNTCFFTLTGTSVTGASPQTSHAVKIITIDGGIFNFNVVAGQTG